MKVNKIKRRGNGPAVLLGLIGFALVAAGLMFGYEKLHEIWCEQCQVVDVSEQVTVISGKMVKPDVIAENLGITNGANLATLDFAAGRREILRKIHTLREITITRELPDRVHIVAEERTPIARMGVRGHRKVTGRVVDFEGMVFICQRGTQTLPTISEPSAPGTPSGQRLSNRARSALTLIETCRNPEFAELAVQDVDISKPDYLLVTLGNYSKAKISWDGMDDAGSRPKADLEARLRNLVAAIRSRVAPTTVIWNATIPDRIFADTQEKQQTK